LAGATSAIQCRNCRHQATLTARYIFGGNKLPLTPGCLALPRSAKQRQDSTPLALRASSRLVNFTNGHGGFRTRSCRHMKNVSGGPYVLEEGCRWMMLPWRENAVVQPGRGSETRSGRCRRLSYEAGPPGNNFATRAHVLLFAMADWAKITGEGCEVNLRCWLAFARCRSRCSSPVGVRVFIPRKLPEIPLDNTCSAT